MNFFDMRIGQGFDAHRFIEGRPLIIGGVDIPYEFGLEGHSDADVLTHAIIDSVLGALSLGNIGSWFPDSDKKYKNINSLVLLEEVIESHQFGGWKICNIDSTLILEKPKIAPYLSEIQKSLAKVLKIDISRISIKGKTTEKMGFCGRGEGIAALVNTLISRS